MDKMYKKIHDMAMMTANAGAGLKLYNLSWWHDESTQWPIFPLLIEETRRTKKRQPFRMAHDWLMITLILEGCHVYEFESSEIRLNAGDVCIIPPNYKYKCETESGYHKLVMMLDGMLLSEICSVLNMNEPLKYSLSPAMNIEVLIRRIATLINDINNNNTAEILGITNRLLSELSVLSASKIIYSSCKLFSQVKKRLGNNFDEKISVRNISSEFNISRSLLHKLFTKYSQTSPLQYRIARKMERACYCLAHTEHSIKEIVFQLGYRNQHYFSNDFKKHHGVTPSEFRHSFHSPHKHN